MTAPNIGFSPAEMNEHFKQYPRTSSIKDYYKISKKSETKTYTRNATDNESSVKISKTDAFKKYRHVQETQNHFRKANISAFRKLKNDKVGKKDHNTNSTNDTELLNNLFNNTNTKKVSLFPSTLESSSQNVTETNMAAANLVFSAIEITEPSKQFPRNASITDYYKISKSETKTYTRKNTDSESSVKVLKTNVFKKYRNVQNTQNHLPKTNISEFKKLKNQKFGKKDFNTNSTSYTGLFNNLFNNSNTKKESLLPSTLESSSRNVTEASESLNVFSSDKISNIRRENILNKCNVRNDTKISTEERKINKNIENSKRPKDILRKFLMHYQKPNTIKSEGLNENMRQEEKSEGKDIFNKCNLRNENNTGKNRPNNESIKTKIAERKIDTDVENSTHTNDSVRKFLQHFQRPNAINSENMNEDTGMVEQVNSREDMVKHFSVKTENKVEKSWKHNKNNKLKVIRKIGKSIENSRCTSDGLKKHLDFQLPNNIYSERRNKNIKSVEKNRKKDMFKNFNVTNENNEKEDGESNENTKMKIEREVDKNDEYSNCTNDRRRNFLQYFQRPVSFDSDEVNEDRGNLEIKRRENMFKNSNVRNYNKIGLDWEHNKNIEIKIVEQKIDNNIENSPSSDKVIQEFLHLFPKSNNTSSESVDGNMEELEKIAGEDYFENADAIEENEIQSDFENNESTEVETSDSSYVFENNTILQDISKSQLPKVFVDQKMTKDNEKSKSAIAHNSLKFKTLLHQNNYDDLKQKADGFDDYKHEDSENNKSAEFKTPEFSYVFQNNTILQDIPKSQSPKVFVDQKMTKDNEKSNSVIGYNSLKLKTLLHQNNYDDLKQRADVVEDYKIKNFETTVKHYEEPSVFLPSQIESCVIEFKSKNIETTDVKQLSDAEHILHATVENPNQTYINLPRTLNATQRSSGNKEGIPSEKSTTARKSEPLSNLLKNACLKKIYTSTKNSISKEIDMAPKEHRTENVTSEPSNDASHSSPDDDIFLMLTKEYEKHKKRQQLIDSEADSNEERFLKCLQKTSLDVKSRNKKRAYVKRLKKGNMKIYRLKKFRKNVNLKNQTNETKTCIKEVIEQLTQNYIEPESQLRKSVSFSSKSTSSSCVTDSSKLEITSDSEKLNTQQDLDMYLKNKSLLFKGKPECSPYYDANEILGRIRNIFVVVYEDIVNEKAPVLEYRRHDFKKHVQDAAQFTTSSAKISSKSKQSAEKFRLILLLMKKIQALLETNTKITKRELYYQMKHVVKNQDYIDRAINAISCILDVGPWAFNVVSQKGLVLGDLKIFMAHGSVVDCSISATLIPQDIEDIAELHSTARFILVVEKEAIFQKLIDEDFQTKLNVPFIMITGKGYPDLNTQLFLRKLWTSMSLPVFILVDSDPHGIQIMLNYKFGSIKNAHLSRYLAVPKAKWIGVYPSEIHKFEITTQPLSDSDLSRINNLLRAHYMDDNPEIVAELKIMLQHKLKAGIEGLIKNDVFLSDVYLTMKFVNLSFI
ncbi:MATH and LRR domain-containing protein PFE0570w isoform X2 [Diabrotica virgifera virgifera]|uniref:DNA topoisomerase (ATP-hydrolyzing) n=1 Tax=Diabrotica virgifera virgifera TaxID=50390 RepID=A0ABM5KQ96_DIAVI|nr:MATH and LRR domain-containing protein PFE0570w isoform X2 [Diabrotica virgifera virgifera]